MNYELIIRRRGADLALGGGGALEKARAHLQHLGRGEREPPHPLAISRVCQEREHLRGPILSPRSRDSASDSKQPPRDSASHNQRQLVATTCRKRAKASLPGTSKRQTTPRNVKP